MKPLRLSAMLMTIGGVMVATNALASFDPPEVSTLLFFIFAATVFAWLNSLGRDDG